VRRFSINDKMPKIMPVNRLMTVKTGAIFSHNETMPMPPAETGAPTVTAVWANVSFIFSTSIDCYFSIIC